MRREAFLAGLRGRYAPASVIARIDWLRRLRVLVVGDAILDEYVTCEAMGKSGKEPVLAVRFCKSELHAGGALAVANHVADFCDRVELVTALGAVDRREAEVRSRLRPAVRTRFCTKTGAPTTVKRRYLDHYTRAKLLGVYHLDDEPLCESDDRTFVALLEELLPTVDVVIAADFGHGLLSPRAIELLTHKAPFLAVNTQINAANTGFHTISKYPSAHHVCLHEGELRLDARDRNGPVEPLMVNLARRLGTETVVVTRGRQGTLLLRSGEELSACPALAETVVERVGAGDAVLAVTSLCVAAGFPSDLVGFLGNLAGAQLVSVVGNSAPVSRAHLIQGVEHFLRGQVRERMTGC